MTSSHLRSHQITLSEYKAKFPKAPIVDPSVSEAISSKLSGRVRSQEHKENLRRTISEQYKNGRITNKGKLGKLDSEETREKKRLARTGAKHSEATKAKIGLAHKGKTQPPEAVAHQRESYLKAIEANGGGFATGPRSDEFKARMSEIARARTEEEWRPKMEAAWEARRNQVITEDSREKYRLARLRYMEANPDKLHKKFFNTIPEQEFEAELIKLGLSYKSQFHTKNPHHIFDFMVEDKFLVEIDGPYHWMLAIHRGDQDLLDKQIAKDGRKNLAAIKAGYRIIRLEVGQHIPADWREILISQGWTFPT